jgi:glutamine amidotransferase
MRSVNVVIVDYGAGNLRSVERAVARAGFEALVSSRPEDAATADVLIVPGVGAAADTMRNLRERSLDEPIRRHIVAGRPFLGVCMGLQALLTASEEGGEHECLGVIPGRVRRLPQGLKVPHMGWNQVHQEMAHPLWAGIEQDARFYFVHSYYVSPAERSYLAGSARHGVEFAAALAHENIFAAQFHPEKSQHVGLQLYANFLNWDGNS